MSKNDAWMPLYIGDYLADTMHLDGPQHGAYLLMLMHYWRNGPLPNDDRALAGIARTERKAWDRDVGPAVREFFTLEADNRLHQKRMDVERAKAGDLSSKRKAAADARWGARSEQSACKPDAHADANAFQKDTHAGARPSASPSQLQSPVEDSPLASLAPSPAKPARRRAGLPAAQIEEHWTIWWDNYPRKVGKGAARKAYERQLAQAGWDPDRLLTPMLLTRWDEREDGKFIPYPATWLNDERWRDGDQSRPAEPIPELPLH
jgi:uncharacterized protein YdaU (DUF1376 family)